MFGLHALSQAVSRLTSALSEFAGTIETVNHGIREHLRLDAEPVNRLEHVEETNGRRRATKP